jgi:hypothetical protein
MFSQEKELLFSIDCYDTVFTGIDSSELKFKKLDLNKESVPDLYDAIIVDPPR